MTILLGVAETKISLGFGKTVVSVTGKAEYDAASIATIVGFKTLRTRLNQLLRYLELGIRVTRLTALIWSSCETR